MKTTPYTSSSEKSPSQPRHDSPLVKLLLRNYANNLRRSWRNTSHAAFVDATIQVEALVTLALAIFFMLIETLVSRTLFPSLSLPVGNTKYSRGLIVVVVIVLAMLWVVDRKLKPYEFVSGIEKAYDTTRDRVIANLCYASGFVLLVLGIVAANYLMRALPVP
jgi:uncharacterized membrane protein